MTTSTFADDTALLASDEDPNIASLKSQENINGIEERLERWKIKVNENKSTHFTFTTCPP